jgi:hypothetical protein
MLLQPDEQELSLRFTDGRWDSTVSARIHALTSQHLQKCASTDAGWSVLYRDPQDGRFWELTYPHAEMHGGGPARLSIISEEAAHHRYAFASTPRA